MGCVFVGYGRAVAMVCALIALEAPITAQSIATAPWFEREVGDGITWHYYHFPSYNNRKQSISYIEIDLNNPNVELDINYREAWVGPSPGTGSINFPRAPLSTHASEVTGAKAAINGTYFNTATYSSTDPTKPWGGGTTFLRSDGNTIHTNDSTGYHNEMAILFNDADDLTLLRRSGTWANRASQWANMMACGPVILENGTVQTFDYTHATARHPRSAVGKNTAQDKLILLTVDGRTDESAGMSCTELGQVMKSLGCDFAINLDGGGSSMLWAAGEPFSGIVNYPSDNGQYDHIGQRYVANALVVKSAPAQKAAFDGRLSGITYNTLTRSGETLPVTVTYTNIGSQTWTSSNVKVVPSRSFGRTSPFIPAGQANTFYSMSPASVAPGQSAQFTLNLTAPSVSSNTNYTEHFALWHNNDGFFGPADNEVKLDLTVRPALTGAPPLTVVQGTPAGANNQWYVEGAGSWANSSIGFSAAGVADSGTQRYCPAGTVDRYADFKPILDVRGVYRVDAAFPYSSNNVTSVRYTVNHMSGSASVNLNQRDSDLANEWQTIGTYSFTDAANGNVGVHSVRVTNGSTTGNRFYSGAVRFDYISPLADVNDWVLY